MFFFEILKTEDEIEWEEMRFGFMKVCANDSNE